MGTTEIALLALLVVVVGVLALVWRRVRAVRRGGIEVALRNRPDLGARGWHAGMGRYWGDEFAWYRIVSLRSGPDRVLARAQLHIVEQRSPDLPETYAIPPRSVVLRCRGDAGELELAMGRDTVTGFLSWLESAPPSRRSRR